MTMNVRGYAALSAVAPIAPFRFERREPRADDVVIEILYCGVCHTDVHYVRNDWGNARYPMVPGHEIIGRVTGVGAEVTRLKPGDSVGVGCLVDSCRRCKACGLGLEQYCQEGGTLTYNGVDRRDGRPTFGGYSERIVVSDAFVVKVPDGLDPSGAAPLLCAGITTWSPLRRWKVEAGSRVAVVGLGGLGHMALKLASALGAEVTLFTRSPGKEDDAARLGADHVVLSGEKAQMAAAKGRFDGADIWHGLVAAKGTPRDIIARMNADINAVLQSPEAQARFTQDDIVGAGGTPQQFGETIRSDMERWRTVVKQANIKVD